MPFVKAITCAEAKSGLVNMTRYLATYWAREGVRTNLNSFGGGKTGSFDRKFIDAFRERVPMGRQSEADEYDGAIRYLASDASSCMTGSNTGVDGGFTAWRRHGGPP